MNLAQIQANTSAWANEWELTHQLSIPPAILFFNINI